MRIKKSILILWVGLLLGNVGCWNSVEMDRLAIVTGVAIDLVDNNTIMLTAQLFKPKTTGGESSGGDDPIWVVSSKGRTVYEAITNFTRETSRKLNWSHNRVIIIGEELAKKGVFQVMDVFARDHEHRPRSWILIAEGMGKDIFGVESKLEMIQADEISELLVTRRKNALSSGVELHKFLVRLSEDYTAAVAGKIGIVEGENKEKEKKLRLEGTSVFRGDKLVGYLGDFQTRGFLWVINEVKGGSMVLNSPVKHGEKVSLDILRAKCKVKAKLEHGELRIELRVFAEGVLAEQDLASVTVTSSIIKDMEETQEKMIKEEINLALYRAQKELKADIFRFSKVIHRKYPKKWREIQDEWADIFTQIPVDIEVEAKIRRTGLIL